MHRTSSARRSRRTTVPGPGRLRVLLQLSVLAVLGSSLMACGSGYEITPEGPSASGKAGQITVQSFYIPAPRGGSYPAGSSAVVELTLFNAAEDRDVLRGASSPVSGNTLVQTDGRTNDRINVPGESRDSMGIVVVLQDLARTLEPGDEVPVTLRFENAGPLTASVPVRR